MVLKSQARFDASLPDCLSSCVAQLITETTSASSLHVPFRDTDFRNLSSALYKVYVLRASFAASCILTRRLPQDAFWTCCTRMREQIAVEDISAANRECCVHWQLLTAGGDSGGGGAAAQLGCCVTDRAADMAWFLSYDSEASRSEERFR